jgi:hypothetical protein
MIQIGMGVDSTWFDPSTGYAMSSCGDGTITVAHEDSPDKYTVADTILTQIGAWTMTIDTKNHKIYTVTAGHVHAADLRAGQVLDLGNKKANTQSKLAKTIPA